MRGWLFALGCLLAAGIGGTPQPVQAAVAAPVTLKLCPDGSKVGYTVKCPTSGTVRKICPSGAIVAYSSKCPVALPPPPPAPAPASGTALTLQACPAFNRPESLVVGQTYKVQEFGHRETGQEFVVLSDATHRGDGWFAFYVPVTCVQLG